MKRVELFDEKLRISVVHAHSSVARQVQKTPPGALNMSMTRIRATHRRWRDSSQQPLPRLGDEREVIRGIADITGALAWRAMIKRYAPNTEPRVQSLTSAILNVKTSPSQLTAYEIALDEWQEDVRK